MICTYPLPIYRKVFEHLTVEQNLSLGKEARTFGFIRKDTASDAVFQVLQSLDPSIRLSDRVSSLSVAQKQVIEIAKAISSDSNVIIMDEPTAAISEDEVNRLFSIINRIKKENDMHAGKWNGLGGKLESGETPEECAIREVWEESGLRVKDLTLKGFITFPAFDGQEDWYTFIFVISDYEGQLIDSSEGFLRWIPNTQLLELNLWPGDRIFIPWLERNGFFSGKFVYKNKELTEHQVAFYE